MAWFDISAEGEFQKTFEEMGKRLKKIFIEGYAEGYAESMKGRMSEWEATMKGNKPSTYFTADLIAIAKDPKHHGFWYGVFYGYLDKNMNHALSDNSLVENFIIPSIRIFKQTEGFQMERWKKPFKKVNVSTLNPEQINTLGKILREF